jgi:hypothetical protein
MCAPWEAAHAFFGRAAVLGLDIDFPNGLCGLGGVLAMRRITSSRQRAISSSVKSLVSLTFGFFAMTDIANTDIPLQLARANAINA